MSIENFDIDDRVEIVQLDTEELQDQTDISHRVWSKAVGRHGVIIDIVCTEFGEQLYTVALDIPIERQRHLPIELVLCVAEELRYERGEISEESG